MAEYFKEPQNPLKKIDETTGDTYYIYPQTTAKQVIMDDDGTRLNTILSENILYLGEEAEESSTEVINADTWSGHTPTTFLSLVYPVGAIYLSVSSISPATLFGGTWQQIAQGRTLFGADGSDYIAGQTVEAGLPNITGTIEGRGHATANIDYGGAIVEASGVFTLTKQGGVDTNSGTAENSSGKPKNDLITFNASLSDAIYGNSETVQPPAFVVYMWQRIA